VLYSPGASLDARDVELTLLSNGKILASFDVARTGLSNLGYTVLGTQNSDDTVTWGTPVLITTQFSYDAIPGDSKPIELTNGTILLLLEGRNTGDTYDSTSVVSSTNGGSTWSTIAVMVASSTATDQYDEANGVQLPNGEIVVIIRHDVGTVGYARVYSNNNGATWSSPVNVINQTTNDGKPTLLLLPSGALFLLTRANEYGYGYRAMPRRGMTASRGLHSRPSVRSPTISRVRRANNTSYMDRPSSCLMATIGTIFARETNGYSTAAYITYQQFLDAADPSSTGLFSANTIEAQNLSATSTLSVTGQTTLLGGVGIGTASPQFAQLEIDTTSDGTNANAAGIYDFFTYAASQNVSQINAAVHNLLNTAISTGNTSSNGVIGDWVGSYRNQVSATTDDGGTLANLYGIRAGYGHDSVNSSSKPITTNVFGLKLEPSVKTGTTTNLYDIYITTPQTGGVLSNHWSFYQQDPTAKNFFAGNVGIGTSTPWGNLSVSSSNSSTPEFVVASSTATNFVVTNSGNVGIGTTTPAFHWR